ncbi:F-box only protein 50-like [Dromiciops gliroides]|uniref:F-box only protein 50-like n=1 Tax=Dromiciops gliroides TaxID=33562 RepID=UPI001CC4597B|nr:F-box only protein 50-like [Dromiciops gliroides]
MTTLDHSWGNGNTSWPGTPLRPGDGNGAGNTGQHQQNGCHRGPRGRHLPLTGWARQSPASSSEPPGTQTPAAHTLPGRPNSASGKHPTHPCPELCSPPPAPGHTHPSQFPGIRGPLRELISSFQRGQRAPARRTQPRRRAARHPARGCDAHKAGGPIWPGEGRTHLRMEAKSAGLSPTGDQTGNHKLLRFWSRAGARDRAGSRPEPAAPRVVVANPDLRAPADAGDVMPSSVPPVVGPGAWARTKVSSLGPSQGCFEPETPFSHSTLPSCSQGLFLGLLGRPGAPGMELARKYLRRRRAPEVEGGKWWRWLEGGRKLQICPRGKGPDLFCVLLQCWKQQVVNLPAQGLWPELLDNPGAEIHLEAWWGARRECGSQCQLFVKLVAADRRTALESFDARPDPVPTWTDHIYIQVSHIFTNFPKGVRFIFFEHAGKDTLFWAGHYGARITHSSVKVYFRTPSLTCS